VGWESEGGCWGEDCIGLRIMEYVHMAGTGGFLLLVLVYPEVVVRIIKSSHFVHT
jgi:hypothetical protein